MLELSDSWGMVWSGFILGFLLLAQSWLSGRSLRFFVSQTRSNSSEKAWSLMFARAACAGDSALLRTRVASGAGDAAIEHGDCGEY